MTDSEVREALARDDAGRRCFRLDGFAGGPSLIFIVDRPVTAAAQQNLRQSIAFASSTEEKVLIVEPGMEVYQLVANRWEKLS